ncbi:KdsC family phosphatase [Aliarcobacter vitoriensis]|uniref:3-deoxy-D-manno-octulosonate 8-phosphate phosphatase n=1 Tax=Aliarcobacter vitoriensis TaxID=2011099 RepID=A0A366MPU4_9BACT|nr:HAD hydrolase family protein [Aliarcobacter vitoriensis]RBQ28301.1 3-deoxy-D-manno-octulosonate 8-phosphate phosphatase [Aliarcobacter vitoriensis]RBQ30871.1 3-deoxy-D-manno-octulosonate 8-phosphate phosphatase [Arcobacter sp. FW59]
MIELLVFDVDGTLTNGDIMYSSSGEEFKTFNVNDGFGIVFWTKYLGKKAAIITGRNSVIVEKRAKELNISHLYQGVKNKLEVLEEILRKESLELSQVAAIGDDLNDVRMLKSVGISFAPQNAIQLVKDSVNIVCEKNGGSGAAREMIDYILKKDDLEEEFLNAWV